MDHGDLAASLLKQVRAAGADAADVLIGEGSEFSVTVRKGEVETLTDAGSKALGIRVFVGKRTGTYRSSSVSLSVVPVAERGAQMERDYWYTTGRGLSDLLSPEEVGRIAAERTVRRLGARQVPTCEVPVVFDPETAAEILGHVFRALSGYSVFRNATFLQGRLGETESAALLTVVDEGRRPRGLGSRPFDGEGLPTRRNVPLEAGVLRH